MISTYVHMLEWLLVSILITMIVGLISWSLFVISRNWCTDFFGSSVETGYHKAYSLPCPVRWRWFFSRWSTGTCAFPVICVSRYLALMIASIACFELEFAGTILLNYTCAKCRYQRSTTAISVGNAELIIARCWCNQLNSFTQLYDCSRFWFIICLGSWILLLIHLV